MHESIHHKCRPRHVAGSFQKGDRHEEQQNVRQKDQHAADAADDSLHQQPPEKLRLPGRPDGVDSVRKRTEERFQPVHRILPHHEGEHEHQIHHQQKDRHTEKAVGHHPVDRIGQLAAHVIADVDRLPAGTGNDPVTIVGHQHLAVQAVAGRDRLPPLFRFWKQGGELRPGTDFTVIFQQLDGKITGGNPARLRALQFANLLRQSPDCLVGFRPVLRLDRTRRIRFMCNAIDDISQLVDPLPGKSNRRDDRSAEKSAEFFKIKFQPAFFRVIDHIEDQHHRQIQLGELRGEVEVSLGVAGVDHVENHIDLTVQQLPERHLLLRRRGGEAVDARQVNQFHRKILNPAGSAFPFDGNPRIISDMLPGSSQRVEDGGLAAIGISGQRHPPDTFVHDRNIL